MYEQSSDSGKLVVTTNRDYDLGEVSKLVRGAYMGIAMMVFLHGYMGYVSLPNQLSSFPPRCPPMR